MLQWQDFSACINIEGKEAVEYQVQITEEEEKTPLITCCIASELGKEFSVKWTCKSCPRKVCGDISMDGTFCTGSIVRRLGPVTKEVFGVRSDGGTTIRPFTFGSLKLTDDEAVASSGMNLSALNLGTIELSIFPVESTRLNTRYEGKRLHQLTLHERAKKGVTQQVVLAPPKPLSEHERRVESTIRRLGPDFVKFRFTYRPIDVLRANGIAPPEPRAASTSQSEVGGKRKFTTDTGDSDAEDSDVREAKRLRAQLSQIEARMKAKDRRIKTECDEVSIIDLTQDIPNRKAAVKRENQGEVIDL
ncbi:hypothetical protein C8F01DRAFT_1180940, partial [Mycena amicta]